MTWETGSLYKELFYPIRFQKYDEPSIKTCCTDPDTIERDGVNSENERYFTPLSYWIIGILAIAIITIIILAIRRHKKSKTDNNLPNN